MVCPFTDPVFTTLHSLLIQDDTPGLQVLLSGQWVDVPPVPGAFIVNLGSFPSIVKKWMIEDELSRGD